jgi:hypothetical protein
MPLTNVAPIGDFSVSAASEYLYETSTAIVADFNSQFIYIPQLPNLVFYMLFGVANVAGSTVAITPQASLASRDGGAGNPPIPIWLDLSGPVVCPLNVPVILNFTFPCALARMQIDVGVGSNVDIQYIVSAFG